MAASPIDVAISHLQQWISSFLEHPDCFSWDRNVKVEKAEIVERGAASIEIHMFTDRNRLALVCRYVPGDPQESFLRAELSSRTPRAGEERQRGAQIYNGQFSKQAIIESLIALLQREFVSIRHHGPMRFPMSHGMAVASNGRGL